MKIAFFLICFSWIWGIKILNAAIESHQESGQSASVNDEEKMSAANAKNTTEKNIIGLEKLGFDSDIMRQIALAKALGEGMRAYIIEKVNDGKIIDQYNDLSTLMSQFIGGLVLKISQNNHFEERESRLFYEKKTKEWIEIQYKLEAMINSVSTDAFQSTPPEMVRNFAPDAKTLKDKVLFYIKEFKDSGEEAVRDILAFTVSSLESFITEKKSPVNQQAVIEYLNARMWSPIAKTVKDSMDYSLGLTVAQPHPHTHEEEGKEKTKA